MCSSDLGHPVAEDLQRRHGLQRLPVDRQDTPDDIRAGSGDDAAVTDHVFSRAVGPVSFDSARIMLILVGRNRPL